MDNLFTSYRMEDRSYASFFKREMHNLVSPWFSEHRTAEIDIIVSEMVSNIIKHAGTGELLYRLQKDEDDPVFELLCIDNGPGIEDLKYSMRDGISSTQTLGQGIGAIMRLSNTGQIYSNAGWGTIVYTKCHRELDAKPEREKLAIRYLKVAKPGESVSGDGLAVKAVGSTTLFMVGDGLGHGQHAKEAVDKAKEAFASSISSDPSQIIREIDAGVKKTRGLVATLAVLHHSNKEWEVCGVGNIHTRIFQGPESKTYICNNGIIGLNLGTRIQNAVFRMEKLQTMICCSDGIKTRWDIQQYPSILKYDPMMLAAAIYKDQARRTDDMTILIVRVL